MDLTLQRSRPPVYYNSQVKQHHGASRKRVWMQAGQSFDLVKFYGIPEPSLDCSVSAYGQLPPSRPCCRIWNSAVSLPDKISRLGSPDAAVVANEWAQLMATAAAMSSGNRAITRRVNTGAALRNKAVTAAASGRTARQRLLCDHFLEMFVALGPPEEMRRIVLFDHLRRLPPPS